MHKDWKLYILLNGYISDSDGVEDIFDINKRI